MWIFTCCDSCFCQTGPNSWHENNLKWNDVHSLGEKTLFQQTCCSWGVLCVGPVFCLILTEFSLLWGLESVRRHPELHRCSYDGAEVELQNYTHLPNCWSSVIVWSTGAEKTGWGLISKVQVCCWLPLMSCLSGSIYGRETGVHHSSVITEGTGENEAADSFSDSLLKFLIHRFTKILKTFAVWNYLDCVVKLNYLQTFPPQT